jgi:hypothetical protein
VSERICPLLLVANRISSRRSFRQLRALLLYLFHRRTIALGYDLLDVHLRSHPLGPDRLGNPPKESEKRKQKSESDPASEIWVFSSRSTGVLVGQQSIWLDLHSLPISGFSLLQPITATLSGLRHSPLTLALTLTLN